MKKFLVLCLVLVLVLSMVACTTNSNSNPQPSDKQSRNSTNTSGEPIQPNSPYNALVAWAGWSENGDIIKNSLNLDKMAISSVQHLPIYKCEKQGDIENFKSQFKNSLSFSHGYSETPSFEETTAGFGADFFDNNTLFLVYVTANSSSFRFALKNYSTVDGTFRADIIQTSNPETHTEDMAGWWIVIPVSNDQLQNVQNYDAVMK